MAGTNRMIFSKYVRVMDISWEDVFFGSVWVLFFAGIYTATIMYSSWTAGREDYKKNLPRKYKEQDEKLKDLKAELKATIKERDGYEDRLKAISLSSEVRGS